MKAADAYMASWITLTHAMQTDSRCTEDEKAALVIMNDKLDLGGDSTMEEDFLVLQALKRTFSDMTSFYAAP